MAADELTVAGLLARRADDDGVGLLAGDDAWTWAEVVRESATRAALLNTLRVEGPPHVGVLLDNVPEFLFWIGGAALAGATVVGINPTRRGEELASDVRHTDCQLVVTHAAGKATFDGLDIGVSADRILDIESTAYKQLVADYADAPVPEVSGAREADLFLLLFTSGTTGAPKAVRCTQGRLASIAERVETQYGVNRDDVCYAVMPLFHGNALMALWAPAVRTGATVALTPKFSASGFLADVRRYQATYFTYVGKALTYVLGTPEQPDDADNTLLRGFGNEASDVDIERFQARFGCRIIEGYGSSEGGAVILRVPDMPTGSLGVGMTASVMVVDPETMQECPSAEFDEGGRLLNAEAATGEIVNTEGLNRFEGYYRNDDAYAQRARNGWYWSGDLAYRDDKGFFWFAGRTADWLRVDGENFAAAPVERILGRFPGVAAAVVYAVPDPRTADQVMSALELDGGTSFDPVAFATFLAGQPDLGTKWAPRFVRIVDGLPLTATRKIDRRPLRADRWTTSDPVWWRPTSGEPYRRLTEADTVTLEQEFVDGGRDMMPA